MGNLYIPKKIKVGFQKRNDTFTSKLAYIIYFDEKGVLRKEASWNGWCDAKIPSIEFDNVPQTGYIFNKGVKRDGHWGSGRSVIRVHDPREFEFEIGVDNLIGILMHSDVSKRDIVEGCVYAWQGKDLVLLPTNSEEYQAALVHSQKQEKKVSSKDLKPGMTLTAKKSNEDYIYIGYFEWFQWEQENNNYRYDGNNKVNIHKCKGKKHIFYNKGVFTPKDLGFFALIASEECVSNYASLVDSFYKTINSQPIKGAKTILAKAKNRYVEGVLIKLENQGLSGTCYHIGNEYLRDQNQHKCIMVPQIGAKVSFQFSKETKATNVSPQRSYGHSYGNNVQKVPIKQEYTEINNELLAELHEDHQVGSLVWEMENGNTVKCDSMYF